MKVMVIVFIFWFVTCIVTKFLYNIKGNKFSNDRKEKGPLYCTAYLLFVLRKAF